MKGGMKKILICMVWICLISCSLSNKGEKFWVVIVRGDGILIPFVMYDNGSWSNPWPRADEQVGVKLSSLKDVPRSWLGYISPFPKQWTLLKTDGQTISITVTAPVLCSIHCSYQWGLATNLYNKADKEEEWKKLGIAINTKRPLISIKQITEHSMEWDEILSFIKPILLRKETEYLNEQIRIAMVGHTESPIIAGKLKYYGLPFSEEERINTPVIMKAVRNSEPIKGEYIYYIEAEKKYTAPDNPSCEGISAFSCWMIKNNKGENTLIKEEFRMSDCDRQNIKTIEPLGIIPVNNKFYWILVTYFYELETYSIVEISSIGIQEVVVIISGGC